MSTDLLKPFRSCFFCKTSKALSRVESEAYNNTFIYYHPRCLKAVLRDPEKFVDYLDQAIQIQDFINRDDQRHQDKVRAAQEKINRARTLYASNHAQNPTEPVQANLPIVGLANSRYPGDFLSVTLTEQNIEEEEIPKTEQPKEEQQESEKFLSRFDILKNAPSVPKRK